MKMLQTTVLVSYPFFLTTGGWYLFFLGHNFMGFAVLVLATICWMVSVDQLGWMKTYKNANTETDGSAGFRK